MHCIIISALLCILYNINIVTSSLYQHKFKLDSLCLQQFLIQFQGDEPQTIKWLYKVIITVLKVNCFHANYPPESNW